MPTTLRKQLEDFMEESGLTLTAISRALGYSVGLLSQWSAGIYPGNVAKIDEAVKGFLEREREKRQTKQRAFTFVMTSVAKKVFEIARISHLRHKLSLAVGDAGLGKTEALREYAKRNIDVLLIEADYTYTAKILFSALHKMCGHKGQGTIHQMLGDIVEKLKGSGRLIIVDEAEHLPYRALENLRSVYDHAGVGILLAGMPRLRENLRGKSGEYAQLYSRVFISTRLEALRPTDTEEIVRTAFPGANSLWKTFHETCCGNARVLDHLLELTQDIATINNRPMGPEIVKEASRMLLK